MADLQEYPAPITLRIENEDNESADVELPVEVRLALASIAVRHEISLVQAIAVSVVNENFLQSQVDDGARLIVKRGNSYRYFEYS